MRLIFVFCTVLATLLFSTMTSAQKIEVPTSKKEAGSVKKIPDELVLWMYPNSFSGRRGLKMKISDINLLKEDSLSGKVVLYGRGLNGCSVRNTPATGAVKGDSLDLTLQVGTNDNLTCRTNYSIKLNPDGSFQSGSYKGESSYGELRLK